MTRAFQKLRIPEPFRVRRFFGKALVVNDKGVVVAHAPNGVHTQVNDGNWENYAAVMAAAPAALRELHSLIEPAEAAGFDMSNARKILQAVEDAQRPYVKEPDPVPSAEEYLDASPGQ